MGRRAAVPIEEDDAPEEMQSNSLEVRRLREAHEQTLEQPVKRRRRRVFQDDDDENELDVNLLQQEVPSTDLTASTAVTEAQFVTKPTKQMYVILPLCYYPCITVLQWEYYRYLAGGGHPGPSGDVPGAKGRGGLPRELPQQTPSRALLAL